MSIRCTRLHLVAMFASVALLAGQAGAAGSSSRSASPPPPPAPAPKPAPSPPPTARAATTSLPSVKITVNATVAPPATPYQPATGNATPAVPQLASLVPRQGIKSPAAAPADGRLSTKAVASSDGPAKAPPAAWRRANAPVVQVAGLSSVQAARLQPRVAQFQQQYRDVEVVHEPTTSGWTWLFLYWALSNHERNAQLEQDNADLRARLDALEPQLRSDPVQWQQLQALAAAPPTSSPQVDQFSEDDVPPTRAANVDGAESPEAEASAVDAIGVDRGAFSLLQPILILAFFVGGGALAFMTARATSK